MSDRVPLEQIDTAALEQLVHGEVLQAEAIARIAASLAADESRTTPTARHYEVAAGAVDALGEMLPTKVERWSDPRAIFRNGVWQQRTWCRYVTAWEVFTCVEISSYAP